MRRCRRLASGRVRIRLRGGLDLPIPGAPLQRIEPVAAPRSVALLGHDHPRARLSLRVETGDRVIRGQALFVDRRHPEIRFVSPVSGVVRHARREQIHEPLAVEVDVDETLAEDTGPAGPSGDVGRTLGRTREDVVRRLLEAGEWPALRARPFGDLADPGEVPDALFVRVMDTHPGAPRAAVVLADRQEDLRIGVAALTRLLDGPVFVCCEPGAELPVADLDRVRVVEFEGPHPAGLVGTHIQHLFPLGGDRRVWYTGYQDVLAIGRLFRTGQIDSERVVSIAGPLVRRPRLVRTSLGAAVGDLLRDELEPGEHRIVSGSPLSGRRVATTESHLGRYHEQLSVLREGASERGGLPWLLPGWRGARGFPPGARRSEWTTALHGAVRAMLPLPLFDAVAPLRTPMTLLLRALVAGDVEGARALGALELEEEDVALASFLCPAKIEYGLLLRSALEASRTGGR